MANKLADQPAKRSNLLIWVAVGAVVVIAAVLAIVLTNDGSSSTATTTTATATDSSPVTTGSGGPTPDTVAPGEFQPVKVTGAGLVGLPESGADPAIGVAAPGLSGYTFDGSPVTVDPSKGPVMLVFLAHWCPHCNREIPQLLAWKESGKVPANLQIIGVTTASTSQRDNFPPSKWVVDKGWSWPVMADSEQLDAATAMGVSGFPFIAIIGTDGKVITRWSGEKGQQGIQDAVDAALGVTA